MFKNKTIKLFLIFVVILFSLVGVVGCSNEKKSFDLNNEKYEYLFEEDYGDNSVVIINDMDELLQQNLSNDFDLSKCDEKYFLNNYLLIFKFKMHYSETDLKVEDKEIVNDNQLLINISINSLADYENNVFDAQISTELLFIDVSRNSVIDINDLSVGILVTNTKFKDVYCSVYYNCKRNGNQNSTDNNIINATYISTYFVDDDIDGQFEIINKHIDLITLLENDVPEKYDNNFFETKSLLVFKIVESSGGNKSEIESYIINDKTLNVYVKTKQYGDTADMGYWWFILELNKKEVENFENVKIYKNGEEIMSELNYENNGNRINSFYVKLDYSKFEDDLTIVDTKKQLVEYLQFKDIKNDTFNKYDDSFFVSKSLMIFTNFEESSENESIISSYIIESNVITINVDTIKESDNGMMSYGYFILELSKDEIKCINEVNIVKNGIPLNIGRT